MVGDIFQPTHLLFVLVVALLVLGPKRLPEVGRTLGAGIRDFQAAIKGETTEKRDEIDHEPWHSQPEPEDNQPEDKHEFAHDGPGMAESHEFAHEPSGIAPTVEAGAVASTTVEDHPSEATQDAVARSAAATAGGPPATDDKHQFAYESDEPAGPAA